METFILLPFVLGAWLANYGECHREARFLTLAILGLMNLLLVVSGALMLAAQRLMSLSEVPLPPEMPAIDLAAVGIAIVMTGLAGFLPMIPPLRRLIAWLLPIDPDSLVHATALVYAIYFLGNSAATLPVINLLAEDEALAQQLLGSFSLTDVWVTGLIFGGLALAGVGLFVRRDWQATLDRLGIHGLSRRQWVWAGVTLTLLLAMELSVSVLWERLDAQSFERVGGLSEAFISSFLSPLGALTVGLSAGIGEELLFRGALQPRFGLLFTALLFTLAHTQYTLSPALIGIFLIALGLGLLRQRVNTTACIAVHAGFNFLQVLLLAYT